MGPEVMPDATPPPEGDPCENGILDPGEPEIDCGGPVCGSCTFEAQFEAAGADTRLEIPAGYAVARLSGRIDAATLTANWATLTDVDAVSIVTEFERCAAPLPVETAFYLEGFMSPGTVVYGECLVGSSTTPLTPLPRPIDTLRWEFTTQTDIDAIFTVGLRSRRPEGGRCYTDDVGHACAEDLRCFPNDGLAYGNCLISRCGDGVIEGPEVCEDGNTLDGDGCSAACLVEDPGEPDSAMAPRPFVAGAELALEPDDTDFFAYDHPGGDLALWVEAPGECPRVRLTLRDASGRMIASADRSFVCDGVGPGTDEALVDLAPGAYVVSVENIGQLAILAGVLNIEIPARLPDGADCFLTRGRCENICYEDTDICGPERCGDGARQGGEECDDAGASPFCTAECTALTPRIEDAGRLELNVSPSSRYRVAIELSARSQVGLFISAPIGCPQKDVRLSDERGRVVPFTPLDGLCGFYETPAAIEAGTYTLQVVTSAAVDAAEAVFDIGSIQRTALDGEACERVTDGLIFELDAPLGCQDDLDCAPTDVRELGECTARTALQIVRDWIDDPVEVRPSDEIFGTTPPQYVMMRLALDAPTAVSWVQLDCPESPLTLYRLPEAPEGPLANVADNLEVARASALNCDATELGELPVGDAWFVVEAERFGAARFTFAPTRGEGERCDVQRKFGNCAGELRCRTDVDDSADGVCAP